MSSCCCCQVRCAHCLRAETAGGPVLASWEAEAPLGGPSELRPPRPGLVPRLHHPVSVSQAALRQQNTVCVLSRSCRCCWRCCLDRIRPGQLLQSGALPDKLLPGYTADDSVYDHLRSGERQEWGIPVRERRVLPGVRDWPPRLLPQV